MTNLRILTIGEPKINFVKEGSSEYLKRLNRFVSCEHIVIKEDKRHIQKIKDLSRGYVIVVLDEKGQQYTSLGLANFLKEKYIHSEPLCFIIGGADGHNEEIYKYAQIKMSFSKMTFPHDLAFLLLTESLYRSFSIINNHPYHRE